MIKKIKNLIEEYRKNIVDQKLINSNLEKQLAELEWANVYHDTIRGITWLNNLSHSPGRWAASYPLLYILVRILKDYKPKNIIEFGLGESSKIISLFLEHELKNSCHTVLENNPQWQQQFSVVFSLGERSVVKLLPLEKKEKNNQYYNGYDKVETVEGKFDLYLVDGPRGTDRFSRFDIYLLAERLKKNDEFILILDDYNRPGEKETYAELVALFAKKEIEVTTSIYSGKKEIAVFATPQYKWVGSL